ncbi:unannotated protein [freshwater metagenome]|uniref:Unannotated protein n=1 Tax=freshwater metagenome TaxID=449393 RepID=A0A6J6GLP6_9ZZZZ
MDFVNERIPLNDSGIEAEVALVVSGLVVPQREEAIESVDGFAFGVRAVNLDISERSLGFFALFFNRSAPLGLFAAQGKRVQNTFGAGQGLGGSLELGLHATATWERPGRNDDRLTFGVIERTLLKPSAHEVHQTAVMKWILRTRSNLDDFGFGFRALCRNSNDRGGNKIDRNDVDDTFGNAREFLQKTTRITDDDWLGHAEAADPAGYWFLQRRFDDRGTHDADGNVAPSFDKRSFAECLCVGICVGPTQRCGTGATGLNHAVCHPTVTQLLSLFSEKGSARSTKFTACLFAEFHEFLGRTAIGFGITTGTTGAFNFSAPINVDKEVALIDELFGSGTTMIASDITRGHRNKMRRDAEFVAHGSDSSWAEKIDFNGRIEGRVKAH